MNTTEMRSTDVVRVYFAGKIEKNGWRNTLFDLRSVAGVDEWPRYGEDFADAPPCPRNGRIEYAGPFFIACDHGCYHGRNQHGVGRETLGCQSGNAPHFGRRGGVVKMCRKWIESADVMFVWLDDPTAYGTLAEIGYAVARGIPTYLYEPPDAGTALDDLWFAREMVNFRRTAMTPIEAFHHFAQQYAPRKAKSA